MKSLVWRVIFCRAPWKALKGSKVRFSARLELGPSARERIDAQLGSDACTRPQAPMLQACLKSAEGLLLYPYVPRWGR
jgi:hypothetical protein